MEDATEEQLAQMARRLGLPPHAFRAELQNADSGVSAQSYNFRYRPTKSYKPSKECDSTRLSPCRCDALMRDRGSIMPHMWANSSYVLLHRGDEGDGPCWGKGNGEAFFSQLLDTGPNRARCHGVQWFGTSQNKHYVVGQSARFTGNAPGLLGFDDAIMRHCMMYAQENQLRHVRNASGELSVQAEELQPSLRDVYLATDVSECMAANRNILRMDDETYNSCWNLHWQVCAARGELPGQQAPQVVFSVPPAALDVRGGGGVYGAAWTNDWNHGHKAKDGRWSWKFVDRTIPALNDYYPSTQWYGQWDIFFLEVCSYSVMCENRDELFELPAGKLFTCKLSDEGVRRLQSYLTGTYQAEQE